jgi:hypothetical protein
MGDRQDRRQFVRLPFSREATLDGAGKHFNAVLEDISLNGARLRFSSEGGVPPSGTYQLTAFLAPGLEVRMTVARIYQRGERVGFRCQSMDDQSLANIRRTLALYYGEGEALEAELTYFRSLIGQASQTSS